MRLSNIESMLIRALYLAAGGILVMQTRANNSMVSLLFTLTFALVVGLWVIGAIREITWNDGIVFLTIFLALLNVVLNAKFTRTAISLGYLKKYIMFSFTLLFFQAVHKAKVDKNTVKFLGLLNSLLVVYLMYFYYTQPVYTHWMNNRLVEYATFRFDNPNLAALFLTCLFMGELLQIVQPMEKKTQTAYIWKGVHIFLAYVVMSYIKETKSRNCILVAYLVLAAFAILYIRKRNMRLRGWLSVLVALFPLIFLVIYVSFVETPFIQSMFSFMTSKGKELDTRLSVWLPALQRYYASPIVGAYSEITLGYGPSQLHNSHLELMASYGTATLIAVSYLIARFIWTPKAPEQKVQTAIRFCFIGMVMLGMGEAAIFSGGLGIYIYAGVFLLLMHGEHQSQGDEL